MPSPIAHSATGYAIAQLFPRDQKPSRKGNRRLLQLFYGIFVALAADLDFIPQLITGERYHHGFSHSIVFTIGFTVIVWTLGYFLINQPSIRFLLLTFMLYSSHLILDFFTVGGPGIQLLWPFTDEPFKSSLAFFPETHHSAPLFQHPGHFVFIIFELSYAALLLGGGWFLSYRKSRHNYTVSQGRSFRDTTKGPVFDND